LILIEFVFCFLGEKRKTELKKEKWLVGGGMSQGWTHLAGCVVWDFHCPYIQLKVDLMVSL
jgi:hypothetical protein